MIAAHKGPWPCSQCGQGEPPSVSCPATPVPPAITESAIRADERERLAKLAIKQCHVPCRGLDISGEIVADFIRSQGNEDG